MQSNADLKQAPTLNYYYIICRPISYNKKLDNDGVASILNEVKNKFPTEGAVYDVFLDKDLAKFVASQFAAREIPSFFNKEYAKKHSLAKPILCLALENPLNLTNESTQRFFGKGKDIRAVHYQTTVNDLQRWQDSNWTILLDEKELVSPERDQYIKNENAAKCVR